MNDDRAFELTLDEALQLLASGVSREECLRRFPHYADELAPLLAAAESARAGLLANQPLPTPNLARGKRRFLEAARASTQRPLGLLNARLVSALLALLLVIVLGAGVASASAQALPGDALYPVKRAIESAQLAVTFDGDTYDELQREHAERRRAEAREVLALQRAARLEFEGVVESVQSTTLIISGLALLTTEPQIFQVADVVHVLARAERGLLVAEAITMLARPTPFPAPTLTPILTPTRPVHTATPTRIVTTAMPTTLTVTRIVPTATATPTATPRVESTPTPQSEVTSTEARPTESRPTETPTPLRFTDTPTAESTATVPRPTPTATATGRP